MALPSQAVARPNTANVGAVIPFSRASRWHVEQGSGVAGVVVATASPAPIVLTVPSYGYLAGIILSVVAAGGGGTAAVYHEDAPWSMISRITLSDVGGAPILSLTGYEAYLAAKFGWYRLFPFDMSTDPSIYTAVATSGLFAFHLPIWLIFGRDMLGCLPNQDASASYRITIQLASSLTAAGGPYTTQATTAITVSVNVHGVYRSQPPAGDQFGNRNQTAPQALGTVQFWSAQTFPSLTGAQTIQLTRVGNLIRNHILIFRDTSDGLRATAETSDLPTSIEYDWDSGVRFMSTLDVQRLREYMAFGVIQPSGVVTYSNVSDPDFIRGAEYGDEWMPTSGSSKLTLRFTPAGTCNLTVLTNDIVPVSQAVYSVQPGN